MNAPARRFSCQPFPRWTPRAFADLGVPDAMSRALALPSHHLPHADPSGNHSRRPRRPRRLRQGADRLGQDHRLRHAPRARASSRAKPRRPRGLVLAPTRELAAQICHELQLLAKPKGPWVEAFYGGVGFDRQLKALRRGVDIAVACPGRLADLDPAEAIDLRDVDLVVIDEADRMADMGFLPEVKRMLDACATDRQTLLFSATLDGDVDVLIRRYQRDPARHETELDESDDGRHPPVLVRRAAPTASPPSASSSATTARPIVFCRTKRGADRVARQLGEAGVKAAAIHGDRSQSQRDRALQSFRRGDVAALVATDVAARGIHVDDVACVVHFDLPADAKDYIHRSGRTGRAGASGLVVSVVPSEMAKDAGHLQRDLGYPRGLTSPDSQQYGGGVSSAWLSYVLLFRGYW